MLTPESIDRLNEVNDLFVAFASTMTSIGTVAPYSSQAQTYMELVIEKLTTDIFKRDGL